MAFTSSEDIKDTTGYDIDEGQIRIAQLLIEVWVGRTEVEVEDGSDLAILARATMLQAIYISGSVDTILEQAAVLSIAANDSTTTFDVANFSPYIAPYAKKACERLSWFGSRTISTGPIYDYHYAPYRWVAE